MTEDPNPPISAAALEAEVARRRARKATGAETVATAGGGIASVAAVVPEIMAAFGRMEAAARAARDALRPSYDAAPDTEPCPNHPEVPLAKDFDATYSASHQAETFILKRALCPKCAAEARAEDERRFWQRRGVPPRVIDATLENFDTSGEKEASKLVAVRKVGEWLKKRQPFLMLIGSTGTGKGHLAAAALRRIGDGTFITHPDLLTDLRASYTLHTTKELIEAWRDTAALVLDEFGLSPGGKDEEPLLYQVLAARYEKRLPTIITSNLTVPEVQSGLGYRLLNRIREDYTLVVMEWSSRRTETSRQADVNA